VCDSVCASAAGATSYCGDSTTDGTNGETCDDGNTTTETCAYGQTSCTVCNSSCASAAGATSYCGDSTTDSGNGETCDDGNTAGGDGCSATCHVDINEWITIPAGDFVMGCATADGGCGTNESPKHTVTLSEYKIQKYEVTNAQYKQCVDAAACTETSILNSYTRSPYYGNATYDNYPVLIGTYLDKASAYCAWIGGRLPTEAEWEKAARGPYPAEPIYPWGDGAANCTLANYTGCTGDTDEVGSHPTGASYYGAMDMAGNVREWVNDWYNSTYYTTGGPPWTDPQGPGTGTYNIARGGTWNYNMSDERASARDYSPIELYGNSGIRCAQD
jgi:cysteine-rich repeat protein